MKSNSPKYHMLTLTFWLLLAVVAASCTKPYTASGPADLPEPTGQATQAVGQATLPAGQPTSAPVKGASPTPPAASAPGGVSVADLYSFHMVNAGAGWASGKGLALRSADSGKTWQDVTPGGLSKQAVLQIFAANAQAAWVLTSDQLDPQRGALYRTVDGGKTWQAGQAPFGRGYAHFLNADTATFMADRGVAAGSEAVDIYRTTDGGANWTLLTHIDPHQPASQGLPFSGNKSGITFLDAARGWLTGSVPMDGVTYLYATTDSGKTWKQVQLALPAGLEKAQVTLDPPVFFAGQEGRLYLRTPGDQAALVFFVSHDGGQNWNATSPLKYVGLVSIPTAKDIYVWDGGILHASHDGGDNFQDLTPNINLSMKIAGFQFVDALNGWAVGVENNGSRLYHTVDGGKTWK